MPFPRNKEFFEPLKNFKKLKIVLKLKYAFQEIILRSDN